MKKHFNNRGFTLIEMLVVIAIIGILTGIIVTNMSGAKAKARDAKRISDLTNIQLALELYFDRCNQYPQAGGTTSEPPRVGNGGTSGQCNKKKSVSPDTYYSMTDFIATIPTPTNEAGQTDYLYSTNITDYVLYAKLERPSSVVKDALNYANSSADITLPYWAQGNHFDDCSNAPDSQDYCVGPK